jgi:hypothetical protein
MSSLSPNNPKTGIGSLRQYFNSRKMDSNNSKSPSRLSPYLKQLPVPQILTKNPFFESSEPHKKVNLMDRRQNNYYQKRPKEVSPPVNKIFYNKAKDSTQYDYSPRKNVVVTSPYTKTSKVNSTRTEEYVVNNFVNINNLNIRNYYNEPNDTNNKSRSKPNAKFNLKETKSKKKEISKKTKSKKRAKDIFHNSGYKPETG